MHTKLLTSMAENTLYLPYLLSGSRQGSGILTTQLAAGI